MQRSDAIIALNVQAIVLGLSTVADNKFAGALSVDWRKFGAIVKPLWQPPEAEALRQAIAGAKLVPRRRLRTKTTVRPCHAVLEPGTGIEVGTGMFLEPDTGAGVLRFLLIDD